MREQLLATLLVLPLAVAQQGQPHRNPQEYIKCLESAERVERLQVDRVIETLQVQRGQHIADLGSGSGLFTRPLAREVGEEGILYAVDIDPALLEHVRQTAQSQGLANVQTVLAAEDDPQLPAPVDLVFICDTLHHIAGQEAYLKNLRRYLRPLGRIAVIDFKDEWPGGHEKMRYSTEELDGWMTSAGYSKVANHDFLENAFFVIYQ